MLNFFLKSPLIDKFRIFYIPEWHEIVVALMRNYSMNSIVNLPLQPGKCYSSNMTSTICTTKKTIKHNKNA